MLYIEPKVSFIDLYQLKYKG